MLHTGVAGCLIWCFWDLLYMIIFSCKRDRLKACLRDKNNIFKKQHDPTVDSRDMATGAFFVPPNSAPLSSRILYCLSPFSFLFFSFLFFFFNWWPFAVLKAHFPLITFMSLIYVFYFIFYVNYPVCFCLNR